MNKKGFTIYEVSIVVAIISIISTVVLFSISLISSSKIDSIYRESIMYREAFDNFYNTHGCMPGGCSAEYALKNIPEYTARTQSNRVCNRIATLYLPLAWQLYKFNGHTSTCAFWDLSAAGFIPKGIVQENDPRVTATNWQIGAAGYHIPFVSARKEFAWAYNTVLKNYTANSHWSNITTLPFELSASEALQSVYLFRNMLVMTIADDGTGAQLRLATGNGSIENINPLFFTHLAKARARYGTLTASETSKLDTKFDDGKPYSGNIWGGREGSDSDDGTAKTLGCTIVSTANFQAATSINNLAQYNVNDRSAKCVVGFLMDKYE